MAEQEALFQKYDVNVRSVGVKGATVPRLTADMPLGMIGEPAALLQAAEGADLRLVASFSDIKLSGHLVAQPGIKSPGDLRGKRLGARVIGAGLWISTILALEQLALDPRRDEITILPVGNSVQIFRALEQGEIDGALVSAAQSRELQVPMKDQLTPFRCAKCAEETGIDDTQMAGRAWAWPSPASPRTAGGNRHRCRRRRGTWSVARPCIHLLQDREQVAAQGANEHAGKACEHERDDKQSLHTSNPNAASVSMTML
jgi:hypothetical protein